jgi:hypothetical protein
MPLRLDHVDARSRELSVRHYGPISDIGTGIDYLCRLKPKREIRVRPSEIDSNRLSALRMPNAVRRLVDQRFDPALQPFMRQGSHAFH